MNACLRRQAKLSFSPSAVVIKGLIIIPRSSAAWVSAKEGFGKPLVSQDNPERSSYIPRRYEAERSEGNACIGVVLITSQLAAKKRERLPDGRQEASTKWMQGLPCG